MYTSTKRRCFTKDPSLHNALDENPAGRRSIQGYKDIQKLNQLFYETKANNKESVVSSSTEEYKEGCEVSHKTLIDILSRTIARVDGLDYQLQQITSKSIDISEIEENTVKYRIQ